MLCSFGRKKTLFFWKFDAKYGEECIFKTKFYLHHTNIHSPFGLSFEFLFYLNAFSDTFPGFIEFRSLDLAFHLFIYFIPFY